MTEQFGTNSTADEVLGDIDLSGKRIFVTGVSSGLGVETARVLAARGATVVGAARDLGKARVATADVVNGDLELVELDLADLASVRACASRQVAGGEPIDLIVANAGVMVTPEGRTVDGFETQFGTNHLGHFALVNGLAPLLRDGSRVVALSSAGHHRTDVDLEDPNFERTPYDPWLAYGRSKTAVALFIVEFDRRHRDKGIRAASINPGAIETELWRHMEQPAIDELVKAIDAAQPDGEPPFRWKNVHQGAATSVWAGVVAPADEIGGKYCEDCHVAEVITQEGIRGGVRPYAIDPEHAKALWSKSEEMIGECF